METKVEKLKQNKVKLQISVSPKEMIKYFDHAYSHLAPSVKLDGFRPGKAPRMLVESTIGVSRIMSEALDMAVNESYLAALKEHNLRPISQPSIAVNKYPNYGQTVEEIGQSLEIDMEISVFPEVTVGDYSKIRIDKPKKEEVKNEDVEKIIENLRKQKATFTETDKSAEKGDWVELNYEGSLKQVRIDSMCSKNHPFVLGEGNLIPGFEEEVIGMKKGEKKTFKIKFPKDYHAKDFAGKEAEFSVEVNNLKKVTLPKLDDEFAKDFGQDDMKILKKEIEKNLALELDKKHETEVESRVLDKVLPLVRAEIPEAMIDEEVGRMIAGYEEQLKKMGMQFETYLKSINKTTDDLKKDMRGTAEKNIKVGLLLGKVIEEQKIKHDDPEAGSKAIKHLVSTIAPSA